MEHTFSEARKIMDDYTTCQVVFGARQVSQDKGKDVILDVQFRKFPLIK